MFCPACHEENPEGNRFCGQCGTPLRDPAHAAGQVADETASRVGPSSFPLQDVIAQPRRGPNGDAGLPSPDDPQGSLSKGGQWDSRPWRKVEPLPKEVIDYDNGLPLLAEPGMDRRRQTPDPVRQAMQEVWGNAAEALAQPEPEVPAPEDLGNPAPDSASEAGRKPESPLDATFARNGVGAAAEDLSRFLDFTPPHHDQSSGTLSGPSFLGLSGDAESPESEDEQQAGKWPRYVAAAVVSAFIAGLVVLTVMHWTSVRGVVSRYERVGVTYIQRLRAGKTASSAKNAGPSSASAGPVSPASPTSNDKSAPDFAVEQHPAQPAGVSASAAVPETPVQPLAAESPAPTAGHPPLNSTILNLEGKAGSGDGAGHTQAVESKQPATGTPRPAAPKPSDQQSSKPIAGQREYQQALAATNPEVARALLWRATALGNSDAPVRLADMYLYGQGVPQNCDQGLILLRLAAQKANFQAQGKLGALYATGKCVSQDRVQAYRWLTLALNDGHRSEWTETNRQMVWREMSPEERSRAASGTPASARFSATR